MTTAYQNRKPDSPKGRVWTAFTTEGEAAARALAEELGLSAGRVNRWLKDNGAGFQSINDRTRERTADNKDDAKPATEPEVPTPESQPTNDAPTMQTEHAEPAEQAAIDTKDSPKKKASHKAAKPEAKPAKAGKKLETKPAKSKTAKKAA